MGTAGRRQSLARCTIYTVRQESQTAESAATQAADRVTPKQAQAVGASITTKGAPRRKRTVQQIDAEEQADRAATEIVDLVEQDAQRTAGSRTGSSTSVDMHQSSSMAMGTAAQSESTDQEEEGGISEWVINESREMNREVTPPAHLFFRDQGERQDGDCGPAAVIGTLYYIYCKAGVTRVALETLLTYRAIRRFAAVHLQQQTLLEVAQVDDTQMVGCQSEVNRVTQDLWTQITRWEANTDPYASTAAGVWEEIAQPESSSRNRQAVWWSDLMVSLVIKAALRHLPIDPAVSTQALMAAQIL